MKRFNVKTVAAGLLASGVIAASAMPAAMAHDNYYNNKYQGYSRYEEHPYLKKAAIGGGAGAILGGLMASDGYRGDGAIKGALLGAGAGVGYEYLKQKGYLDRW